MAGTMGKQSAERPLKINTKKLQTKACMEELSAFMACMSRAQFDIDERCKLERTTLMTCAQAAARRSKATQTINYHLQRIARWSK